MGIVRGRAKPCPGCGRAGSPFPWAPPFVPSRREGVITKETNPMHLWRFFLRPLFPLQHPFVPHRTRRVRTHLLPYLERLEERRTPATLTINNTLGTLVYQAGAGVNNAFSLTGDATTYTFQDTA